MRPSPTPGPWARRPTPMRSRRPRGSSPRRRPRPRRSVRGPPPRSLPRIPGRAGAGGAAGVVLFGPTEGRRWRPLAGRLVALGARGGGPDGIPLAALPAARVIAACARRFTLTRGDPDTNVAGYDLTGRS